MAEINVKLNEINNAISKLQNLRFNSGRHYIKQPTTIGGGETVNQLEEIANTYQKLDDHLGEMIDNSILLLKIVASSFAASDNKAASGISKKG